MDPTLICSAEPISIKSLQFLTFKSDSFLLWVIQRSLRRCSQSHPTAATVWVASQSSFLFLSQAYGMSHTSVFYRLDENVQADFFPVACSAAFTTCYRSIQSNTFCRSCYSSLSSAENLLQRRHQCSDHVNWIQRPVDRLKYTSTADLTHFIP